MSTVFIPLLLGTAREGRESEKVARFVYEIVQERPDIETEFIDVRDYRLTATIPSWVDTEEALRWRDTMRRADGLIIVSPEYNHGYPGELKLVLDQAYPEYNRKPLGICAVSSGMVGGARMTQVLRIAAIELQMVPVRNSVFFRQVKDLFDESGAIQDPSYNEHVTTMLDELVWYANALKSAREGKTAAEKP
ncbi:MAG: NAD(P)H-dependent oxidoreductase [Candidatus Shapirobacteria bacterium]|nr:NAD(P)H-dependent oxidoreductase [Candidatus Shapirobacteria bacterium]